MSPLRQRCSRSIRRATACMVASAWLALTACHGPARDVRAIGVSLNPWDDDVVRKAELEGDGICVTHGDVVAWFPRSAGADATPLSPAEMDSIVARLDSGIRAAKAFIGAADWSFRGDRRIYYYFADANFISHAPGGNVAFIPLWRIREDKAPWLHESMHLLMKVDGDWLAQPEGAAEARMPLWLHEGLAEGIAMEVAARNGFAHFSPLIDVPADQLDTFAAKRIAECPVPQRLLQYVGRPGKLPELFGEQRMQFAVAFYAASTSFVRHLARDDGGYQHLLAALAAFDREGETYKRLSGRSLEAGKRRWLASIGLDADALPVLPAGDRLPAGSR
jgi:hypothetical protein